MNKNLRKTHFTFLALLAILILGAYFRFVGLDWDVGYHLHPDERFLTMIETAIQPVSTIGEYFDTDHSSLNPHNVLDANGNQTFPFFVYGNFPIILVRYAAELLGKTGYSEVHLVGRALSAIFDVGTIVITFLIARKLTKSNSIALLSAFFYACAPLAIQISHFFIVDNFTTFFTMLAFLFAAQIAASEQTVKGDLQKPVREKIFKEWRKFGPFLGFAVALGLAAASKINAIVIAPLLPAAVLIKNPKYLQKARSDDLLLAIRDLILAAVVSFFTFRIFQPYAFAGPGFFNISLNPRWIDNLKELSALSSGLSNYPPSLQWTRRSVLFPLKNMIIWGMGIVFGVFSAIGFVYTAVRIIKGEWKSYGLLFIWNTAYLMWQIFRWNPTMRYFLLIYPTMAVAAAIFVVNYFREKVKREKGFLRPVLILICLVLFITGLLTPFAFINIYRSPVTRVAASEWIYENIEGAVNLELSDATGEFIQPLPHAHQYVLEAGKTINIEIGADNNILAEKIAFDHIKFSDGEGEQQTLLLQIFRKADYAFLGETSITGNFRNANDFRGDRWSADLLEAIEIKDGEQYVLSISSVGDTEGFFSFFGSVQLEWQQSGVPTAKNIFEFSKPVTKNQGARYTFQPFRSSELSGVNVFRIRENLIEEKEVKITAAISDTSTSQVLARGEKKFISNLSNDYRGAELTIPFEENIRLESGQRYELDIQVTGSSGEVFLSGSKTAKETDWDDALPLFMHGLNPFDQYSGIYQSDLNFQMYWEDNAEKQARFISILDEADYIIISSSRQWGSVTQAPEKYPLSTKFYRELIDCGSDHVQTCFVTAQAGTDSGPLGFYLWQVFQSEPEIFGLQINSQYAEEAFKVYDHPKVFVFKKSEKFDFASTARSILSVDIDKALNISSADIEKRPGLLLLPPSRWENQRAGGTWSDIFNYRSLINRYQPLAVAAWYLGITVIGLINFPVTRIAFSRLKDKGWGLHRLTGLILLTYLNWLVGSTGLAVTRYSIFLSLCGLLLFNFFLFLKEKQTILEELKTIKKTIFATETILAVLFVLFLLIRLGNPDLWHPFKGGEKPMDFSYFNAVIKSVNFPPYDPWYAGGYINYYYWGFLIAAIPTKLFGIVPSMAYNLILPIFFGFTGIGAYSVGTNLTSRKDSKANQGWRLSPSMITGLLSILFVLIIGNLGTIKMIAEGILKLGRMSSSQTGTGVFSVLSHLFNGIISVFQGGKLTNYPGDWYWIPSRAIPGEPITEFPFFTFLYGDPHAHLFALPVTLLSLNWAVSLLKSRLRFGKFSRLVIVIFIGALITGALRPTNTWDYPVFLLISALTIVFAVIAYRDELLRVLPAELKSLPEWLIAAVLTAAFLVISYVLFLPFSRWYGQGYTSIALWDGDTTPFSSFITHWGLFVLLIITWLLNETYTWLKNTPISKLETIYNRRIIFICLGLIFLGTWVWLLARGVIISLVVFPAIFLLLINFFRKEISDEKRLVLVLCGAGLGLIILVETIVLSGDIGRMNTVFKFYLQAWTLLALTSAWFLVELLKTFIAGEKSAKKSAWQTIFLLLVFSTLLYPVVAGIDKINDRMADDVPPTLDGMSYMSYATYSENDVEMDLRSDYALIRWMQDNIMGTPVIIEGHVPEYRWGNRVTINTGLPGVIGWNWHQRQQRTINPHEWVFDRVEDVGRFYSTQDIDQAISIIDRYEIEYVVIGELERAIYPPEGIDKFLLDSTDLFEIVYQSEDTYLLRVIDG